jgi:phosphohistidine phosphatase SixA
VSAALAGGLLRRWKEAFMVIFLLRHADKQPGVDDLSKAGVGRAELLARMLGESGIRIAYCSDARRTRRTLDPLEQKLGNAFAVVEVSTEGASGIERHVEKIVEAVEALPTDAVAAVVGHTNTIPQIIKGLAGSGDPGEVTIAENEFDKLFVLFIGPSKFASLLKLRYGAPT